MKWFIMLLLFVGGIYYLVTNNGKKELEKKQELTELQKKKLQETEAPLPVKPQRRYDISFSLSTLVTLRALSQDANAKVRFAAVELLWQLQDEQVPSLIKKMFEDETETEVKAKIIKMLAKDKSKLSLALITVAIGDYDKATRLKAVEAIGTFSNKEALVSLEPAMKDYDEEIRLKSIEAANRIRKDIQSNKEQILRDVEVKPLFRIE